MEAASPSITGIIEELTSAFPDKPIAVCLSDGWLYDIKNDEVAEKLEEMGKAAVFTCSSRAVKALSRLAEYSEFSVKGGG